MTIAFYVLLAIGGLAVGSFCNVLIWRIPGRPVLGPDGEPQLDESGEPIVKRGSVFSPSRSECPQCHAPIRWYDNVPLLSYAVLRGRCRECKTRISIRYPIVEAICATLFVLYGIRFGLDWELPIFLILAAGLLVLSVIDLELYLLPNRLVYPLGYATGLAIIVAAVGSGDLEALWRSAITAVVTFIVFLLMHLAYPKGMGFGDVRLSFILGLGLGYLGVGFVLVGIFLAYLLGAVVGIGLMIFGGRTRKQHIPFGPFLAAGSILASFVGQPILDWYLRI